MDYLELDNFARRALGELSGDVDSHHISSNPSIPSSAPLRMRPRRRVEATYLLRLEYPFPTARDVANALRLSRVPRLESGIAEDGEANFCRLSQSSIDNLNSWITNHLPNQKLTKIRVGLAHHDPGELPLLGRDATLPHHRPDFLISPTKQIVLEYPVHYFFYGTLADAARLSRLFGIPASKLPPLQPATLLDGRVKTWAGKYKALVDDAGAMVDGSAFVVTSGEQADALRAYEGDNYEVVVARLIVGGEGMFGRTFRFAGFDDELTE